jgi:hypothetical protein
MLDAEHVLGGPHFNPGPMEQDRSSRERLRSRREFGLPNEDEMLIWEAVEFRASQQERHKHRSMQKHNATQ